jgi:WD40 repeat protein
MFGLALLVCGVVVSLIAWFVTAWWPQDQGNLIVDTKPDRAFSVRDFTVPDGVDALTFSPDSKYLAAGSRYLRSTAQTWEGEFVIWEAETGKEFYRNHFRQWVRSVAFHPNGDYVAISISSNLDGCPDGYLNFPGLPGEIRVYSFPAMKEIKHIEFVGCLVGTVQFSWDGKSLAVARLRGTRTTEVGEIVVFDFPSFKEKTVIKNLRPVAKLTPFAFAPDDKAIVAFQRDTDRAESKAAAYDANTGKHDKWLKLTPSANMEMTKGGIIVVSGPRAGLWDYAKDDLPEHVIVPMKSQQRKLHTKTNHASLSPDAKRLLVVEEEGEGRGAKAAILIEEIEKRELTLTMVIENRQFNRCCWAPDGRSFAVGGGYVSAKHKKEDPHPGNLLLLKPKNP